MTSFNSKLIFIAILTTLLNGCAQLPPNYAPVTTNHPAISDSPKDGAQYHLVKKGDTLYAISLLFDLDYRQLAQWNHIAPPYTIVKGQKLRLSDPNLGNKPTLEHTNAEGGTHPSMERSSQTARIQDIGQRMEQLPATPLSNVVATPKTTVAAPTTNRISSQKNASISLNNIPNLAYRPSYKTETLKNSAEKYGSSSQKKSIISIDNENMLMLNFQWPIKGRILESFSQSDNKGIDIVGEIGQDVSAAEAGKVVYSGQGLIGYGNLLIIKHNDLYLSAYANNSQLLVTEGYRVEKGEVVAKVGQEGANQASLHFEIRKNGKPVNPLNYLPEK